MRASVAAVAAAIRFGRDGLDGVEPLGRAAGSRSGNSDAQLDDGSEETAADCCRRPIELLTEVDACGGGGGIDKDFLAGGGAPMAACCWEPREARLRLGGRSILVADSGDGLPLTPCDRVER